MSYTRDCHSCRDLDPLQHHCVKQPQTLVIQGSSKSVGASCYFGSAAHGRWQAHGQQLSAWICLIHHLVILIARCGDLRRDSGRPAEDSSHRCWMTGEVGPRSTYVVTVMLHSGNQQQSAFRPEPAAVLGRDWHRPHRPGLPVSLSGSHLLLRQGPDRTGKRALLPMLSAHSALAVMPAFCAG